MIMNNKKKVALVAHDNMKRDLAEWVDWNWEVLLKHHLIWYRNDRVRWSRKR